MGSFDALTKLGKLPERHTALDKPAQHGYEKPQKEPKSQDSLPRPARIQEKTVPQRKDVGKGSLNWQSTRPFKKITCDIFLDQYEALDAYILRYRLETKTKLEMITLIREAIDEYIEKHHLKQNPILP